MEDQVENTPGAEEGQTTPGESETGFPTYSAASTDNPYHPSDIDSEAPLHVEENWYPTPGSPLSWPHWVVFSLIGILVLTGALLLALPVRDTDLWWQMGMGKYLINNKTLVLDQTAFSWTPAHGSRTVATVYCAWIAELTLYGLHQLGGLPLLFAFRYLCFALLFVFVGIFAWKRNMFWNPLVWLAALLAFLMAYSSAAYIKPEIFSFVLMSFTLALWYGMKTSTNPPWILCYLFPVLSILWANTHGGFIVGVAVMGAIGFGELANSLLSPHLALPLRVRKHLFAALMMAFALPAITPYWTPYLQELVLGQLVGYEGDEKTIEAYLSIFTPVGRRMHLVEYLTISSGLILSLLVPQFLKKNFDWAVMLVYASLTMLYMQYLRTCYFGGIGFAFTFIYLLNDRDSWAWARTRRGHAILCSLVYLYAAFLSFRAIKDRVDNPGIASWIGFGTSYYSVTEETDYVEKYLDIDRIGNDYVSGGYLLWKLYPKVKVMIDPRHFPFHSWFREYRAWELGHDVPGFLRKYPCDVWLMNHRHRATIDWYNKSSEYKLAFFGASAVVYVKKHVQLSPDAPKYGDGLGEIRSVHRALEVLNFATNHQQWEASYKVLDGMRKNFNSEKDAKLVESAECFLEGIFAYFERDYARATTLLQTAKDNKVVWSDNLLAQSYIHLSRKQWSENKDAECFETTRKALAAAQSDLVTLFNAGVVGGYLAHKGRLKDEAWKNHLATFLKLSSKNKNLSRGIVQIAHSILAGKYDKRPPLLRPKEPAPDLAKLVGEIKAKFNPQATAPK